MASTLDRILEYSYQHRKFYWTALVYTALVRRVSKSFHHSNKQENISLFPKTYAGGNLLLEYHELFGVFVFEICFLRHYVFTALTTTWRW